jgi:hypothetical protein
LDKKVSKSPEGNYFLYYNHKETVFSQYFRGVNMARASKWRKIDGHAGASSRSEDTFPSLYSLYLSYEYKPRIDRALMDGASRRMQHVWQTIVYSHRKQHIRRDM